jgi:hypothetical protein
MSFEDRSLVEFKPLFGDHAPRQSLRLAVAVPTKHILLRLPHSSMVLKLELKA